MSNIINIKLFLVVFMICIILVYLFSESPKLIKKI